MRPSGESGEAVAMDGGGRVDFSEPERDAEASVPRGCMAAQATGTKASVPGGPVDVEAGSTEASVPEADPIASATGQVDVPCGVPEADPIASASRECHAKLGVEAYLPGGEWRDDAGGAVFVHERLRSEFEAPRSAWGRLGRAPDDEPDLVAVQALGLEHVLFLDLETGGFSSSPVFLAGTMHWNGSDFVLRQYFARHYGEERTLLRAVAEAARRFAFLVTFNGKSYDAPFLRDRARVHGVPLLLPGRHLDLLHLARRRWRRKLANCRLQTLELYVCRRRRSGDVRSEEVPGLYHDFVRRGDPYRLIPVFHHNLLDVITMHELLTALCSGREPRRLRGWEEVEEWDAEHLRH